MGGGSAGVRPYRNVSPLSALTERTNLEITYAQGCDIDRTTPPIETPILSLLLKSIFQQSQYRWRNRSHKTYSRADFKFFGSPTKGVDPHTYSFSGKATITPEISGKHELRLVQSGKTRIRINNEVIIDATEGDYGKGDDFFGMGSAEITAEIDLQAGREVPIEIEFSSEGAILMLGCRIGLKPIMERDLLQEAEDLAAKSDVAVVIVGTNDDWETEGRDRDSFSSPATKLNSLSESV